MLLKPESVDAIERLAPEWELVEELHELNGQRILEVGCGRALLTRQIATTGHERQLVALEVDQVQHAINLEIEDLPNVHFGLGSAQELPVEDCSFDSVFLFKSLHHVPVEHMDRALDELARVLKPGGRAHISEPLYMGAFNEILRLFHDEEFVRREAYAAVQRAVDRGLFRQISQCFFRSPGFFADFAEFKERIIDVSHLNHNLSDELLAEVKARFEAIMQPDGAHFSSPCRIVLLVREVR